MPELPKGLRSRRRQSDGKLEVVGTNVVGEEYVARVCETEHFTDTDAEILDIGSPEKRDANRFIGYYRDQRDTARRNWEHALDAEYTDAADRVVHAGMHLSDSRVSLSCCHMTQEQWDRLWLP